MNFYHSKDSTKKEHFNSCRVFMSNYCLKKLGENKIKPQAIAKFYQVLLKTHHKCEKQESIKHSFIQCQPKR